MASRSLVECSNKASIDRNKGIVAGGGGLGGATVETKLKLIMKMQCTGACILMSLKMDSIVSHDYCFVVVGCVVNWPFCDDDACSNNVRFMTFRQCVAVDYVVLSCMISTDIDLISL